MTSSASLADAQKMAENVQALEMQTEDVYAGDGLDPVYQAKARILNDALQEIGMGKYQVSNFFLFNTIFPWLCSGFALPWRELETL